MSEPRRTLGRDIAARMAQITLHRIGDSALENARRNRGHLERGESVAALRGAALGRGDAAVIVAAGPSVQRHDPVGALLRGGYEGAVIATDSAMRGCLRAGLVPDLVVTVDPHPDRIVRWFGLPDLHDDHLEDDYFRRQDMDRGFADERQANDEIVELLDRYGSSMRIALSTSASEAVVERALSTGMKIYWWNPMLDDPDEDGMSQELQRLNGLPCINAGGNVGTACWMIADAVLGKRRVALTGVDFSYYADTPRSATQYYRELLDLLGEARLEEGFVHIRNPHLDAPFYTDPAYLWYRDVFLELLEDAECETWNCTGGGILFGDGIRWGTLDAFIALTKAA